MSHLDKMAETKKLKPYAHLHMIRRQSMKFQISPIKDIRGVAGKDWTYGRNDGMTDRQTDGRTQTDEGHFYSPLRLRRVTMNRFPAGTSHDNIKLTSMKR